MRLKSLLVCLMLLVWTGTALAGATLTVGTASYTAGKTVTVPVVLTTNATSISVLSLDVTYDTSLLSNPVGTVGAGAVGKALYANVLPPTGNVGKYRILIAGGMVVDANSAKGGTMTDATGTGGTSSVLTDGVVANITFNVAGAATGTIALGNYASASDPSANTVLINGVAGAVTSGKLGNCNGDPNGDVNGADLQYAINIVNEKAGFAYSGMCDVNRVNGVWQGDGRTDGADIQALINVLIEKAGWILP